MNAGHHTARVLVSGSEYPSGLATIRGLRSAGFEPWAAESSSGGYGALSRAAAGVVKVPDPRIDAEAFSRELSAAATRIGADVVLPGTESALMALSRHHRLFPADVAVGAPPESVALRATDKEALPRLAADAGLTVPTTELVTSADVAQRAGELQFPAVVKPVRSELTSDGRTRRFEVVKVADAAELAAALRVLPDQAGLVQPYLTGRIRTVNGVAWNGEVVAAVHKLAARTWPLDCGMVCYASTVPVHPELDTATRLMIAELGWSGIFNLQLIETGSAHHVIDLNPRPYQSLALAIRAGANLPAIWASLLLGRTPTVRGYRSGVHFRAEEDLYALWKLFRGGEREAALRGIVPRSPTVHAVFSPTDPVPTLGTLRRISKVIRPASPDAPSRQPAGR